VQWQVFFPCCVLGGLLCGVLHECSFLFHFALQSEKDFDVGYCFWKEATVSHITDVPVAYVLSLSGKDVEKLSRSQFSLSVGGTPTFRKPTTYFVSNSSWWRLSSTPSATRSAKLMCSSAKRLTWGIPWALSHVVPLPSASLRWRENLIFIFKMTKIFLLCRRADLRRSWCSIVHRVYHQRSRRVLFYVTLCLRLTSSFLLTFLLKFWLDFSTNFESSEWINLHDPLATVMDRLSCDSGCARFLATLLRLR
jgi:hypothetical protein